MKNNVGVAIRLFLLMTVLTGIVYPGFITVIGQLLWKQKANGSLIERNGIIKGSGFIGQEFDSSGFFLSRPSAVNYNPLPSGGSNFGPTNRKLAVFMKETRSEFVNFNRLSESSVIPVEMYTSSASGLDPHISPEAAFLQESRIASARNFNSKQKKQLHELICRMTEGPQFHIFGETRINVFALNLMLDSIR